MYFEILHYDNHFLAKKQAQRYGLGYISAVFQERRISPKRILEKKQKFETEVIVQSKALKQMPILIANFNRALE